MDHDLLFSQLGEKKKGESLLWQKEKELFLPIWEWKLQCKRKLD